MTSDRLHHLINHYARSHRNPWNELIHCACVPAILFAVLGLIVHINLAAALVAIAIAMLYYARLSARAALEMAVILIAMLAAWRFLVPANDILPAAITIFVIAWIGQFIGHAIEGAKPSFLEDVQYLMIGPLFVTSVLKRRRPTTEPDAKRTGV
jgi:uncharacterized membrane protein YGL010W